MDEKQFHELISFIRTSITALLIVIAIVGMGGTITACYLIYSNSRQSITIEHKDSKAKARKTKVNNSGNLKNLRLVNGYY